MKTTHGLSLAILNALWVISAPAQADTDAAWHFDLDAGLSREHYANGTLETAEVHLAPSVSLGDFDVYADVPYYGKKADFSGAVNLFNRKGLLRRTITASRGVDYDGMGDITAGVDYTLPLPDDRVLVVAGASYKSDNGDQKQLLGSGTRDTTATLDGKYLWRVLDIKGGVGHVRSSASKAQGGTQSYTFWSAGLAAHAGDAVTLGVDWSDQQTVAGAKTDNAAVDFSVKWSVSRMLVLNAGYRHFQSGGTRGQPDHSLSAGATWSL